VLDGDLASPTERGIVAPTFWPMSIVAKRSLISAAELLFLVISVILFDVLGKNEAISAAVLSGYLVVGL